MTRIASARKFEAKKPGVVVAGVEPSQRYLVGGVVVGMPAELTEKKIPRDVIAAHGQDVSETLDKIDALSLRLSSCGLSREKIMLGSDAIAREVMEFA